MATDERSQIEDQESEDLLEGLRLIELSEGENTTAKADELQNGTVGQMSQWESSNETSVDYEFQSKSCQLFMFHFLCKILHGETPTAIEELSVQITFGPSIFSVCIK